MACSQARQSRHLAHWSYFIACARLCAAYTDIQKGERDDARIPRGVYGFDYCRRPLDRISIKIEASQGDIFGGCSDAPIEWRKEIGLSQSGDEEIGEGGSHGLLGVANPSWRSHSGY